MTLAEPGKVDQLTLHFFKVCTIKILNDFIFILCVHGVMAIDFAIDHVDGEEKKHKL